MPCLLQTWNPDIRVPGPGQVMLTRSLTQAGRPQAVESGIMILPVTRTPLPVTKTGKPVLGGVRRIMMYFVHHDTQAARLVRLGKNLKLILYTHSLVTGTAR
jgi:hypothetical protein